MTTPKKPDDPHKPFEQMTKAELLHCLLRQRDSTVESMKKTLELEGEIRQLKKANERLGTYRDAVYSQASIIKDIILEIEDNILEIEKNT